MPTPSLHVFALAFLPSLITAAATNLTANYNPSGTGCVDPSGFLSCYSAQGTKAVSCVNFCDSTIPDQSGITYQNCVLGCEGAWLAGNIGCWIQGCWNQVYSCGYQIAAMNYFEGTDLVQNSNIPFYPPPPDASAGACSCNLGYVYGNITAISQNLICEDVAGTGDLTTVYACECCAVSWPISNSLNSCPNSDLSILGFSTYLTSIQKTLSVSPDNCAILDNSPSTCVNTYNYPFVGNTVYNPLNLPPGEPGSEPLTNTPGNAFTDFGASTYSLSLFPGFSTTITPAPFNAKAGAATGTAASGGAVNTAASGATVPATGTAAGSAAATRTVKSNSSRKASNSILLVVVAVCLGVFCDVEMRKKDLT